MAYQFRKAVRERTPLLIGLVGPSGSGKTYSALRLAAGIQQVGGGKIAVIDTEARRALHYAEKFQFEHLDMKAPFGSLNYLDAIQAAIATGAKTVMIDSMSHEHEGVGGYLEMHEAELDRMCGEDKSFKRRQALTFSAWIKPAGNRRKLINFMLQVDCNFIFCFRAKEKLKIQKGKDPIELGWQAIAGEEFVYEMLIRCLLPPGARGRPDWSPEASALGVPKIADGVEALFEKPKQLDEEIGARLAKWAAGETPAQRGRGQSSGFDEKEESAEPLITAEQSLELHALLTEGGRDLVEEFRRDGDLDSIDDLWARKLGGAKKWIARQREAEREQAEQTET